jgi:hypothetical protein
LDAIVIIYLSLYISNSSSKYDNNKIGACYNINDGPLLLVDQSNNNNITNTLLPICRCCRLIYLLLLLLRMIRSILLLLLLLSIDLSLAAAVSAVDDDDTIGLSAVNRSLCCRSIYHLHCYCCRSSISLAVAAVLAVAIDRSLCCRSIYLLLLLLLLM